MFKKALPRYLLAVVFFTGVIALVAFFNAWTFAPHVAPHAVENKAKNKSESGQKTYLAYAVSNGWHVGVVVPAGRINALLPELKKRFQKNAATGVNYYEIGWGDQGFYEAKEITTLTAVQAMFNSPGSVMHVVAVHNPAKTFDKSKLNKSSQVVKFCLTEAQLANLEKYIVSSFATTTKGELISRRPGLYGDSEFYQAAGTYHFLNSCNTWAAKALRSAGFDISPTFKLFASQVMNNMDVSDGGDTTACQVVM